MDQEHQRLQQRRDRERQLNSQIVLNVMRRVEMDLNAGALQNPDATSTNRIDGQDVTHQMVSSVIVNERASSFTPLLVSVSGLRDHGSSVYETIPGTVDSLLENLDIRQLDNRWQGQIATRRRIYQTTQIHEYHDYLTTFALAEDAIVIRFILLILEDGLIQYLYFLQIIWNSRFSWRHIMQHVNDNTYHFNFIPEHIIFVRNNNIAEQVNRSPSEVVDGLPDVIIRRENNDDGVECTVCYETFKNEETAKQLECNHLFHSNCILQWFTRRINCPKCRTELN